jgi:hypothetical protein
MSTSCSLQQTPLCLNSLRLLTLLCKPADQGLIGAHLKLEMGLPSEDQAIEKKSNKTTTKTVPLQFLQFGEAQKSIYRCLVNLTGRSPEDAVDASKAVPICPLSIDSTLRDTQSVAQLISIASARSPLSLLSNCTLQSARRRAWKDENGNFQGRMRVCLIAPQEGYQPCALHVIVDQTTDMEYSANPNLAA